MQELAASVGDTTRLEKLGAAGVALTSTLSVPQVLQTFVDLARELADARYAALGVMNAEGTALSEFYTSGISEVQRKRLATLPVGHGVLGVLLSDPQPLRLRRLSEHPAAAGLPERHPHMESFIGVPLTWKNRVFGNLYCTEKVSEDEFTQDDVALLQMLGAHAAAALENARLLQERDRFFASVAHELGNAVAGIKLWTQHLLEKSPDAPVAWLEGLGKIYKGAENAHRLIDDLLSLARIREGKLVLAPWPTDIAAIVVEVAEQFRPELTAGGFVLDLSAVAAGLKLDTDPTRVRQILINLLSNATRFSTRGTAIYIGAQRMENEILCWVRDEGPGIAPEDVKRIFMPYEQIGGAAHGRGAGLGLPLSCQLARLMGGDLWVESEPGRGATFKLTLRQMKR